MSTPAEWYPKDHQARLQSRRETISHPVLGYVDRIYCISCGRPAGAVNCDCPSAIAVCRACAGTYGGLPLPKLTDEDLERVGYKEGH